MASVQFGKTRLTIFPSGTRKVPQPTEELSTLFFPFGLILNKSVYIVITEKKRMETRGFCMQKKKMWTWIKYVAFQICKHQ